MQNGDILEIVSRGRIGAKAMNNVYHMRVEQVSITGGAFPLNTDVMSTLLGVNYELLIEDIAPWTYSSVSWLGIDVRNLFNPTEVNSKAYPTPYVGTNASNINNNFTNPVIMSTRKIVGMHGGRKALAPVSESVSGGNIVDGGLVASLAIVAAKWNTEWNVDAVAGVSFDMRSVIVKRIRTATGNPKRPWKYNLPTSQLSATYYVADNWDAKTFLGSQVSRKVSGLG